MPENLCRRWAIEKFLCTIVWSLLSLRSTAYLFLAMQVFQLNIQHSASLSMLPWITMAVGSLTSGFIADSLVRHGVRTIHVRKAFQTLSFFIPATCLLVLLTLPILPTTAAFVLACALGA